MNKSRMMVEFKELYGGHYVRDNGRWFWKQTLEAQPILVSGGWLIRKLNEAKTKKSETISTPEPVVEKKEENFSPLPTPAAKKTPVKKKSEAPKDEPKAPEAQ